MKRGTGKFFIARSVVLAATIATVAILLLRDPQSRVGGRMFQGKSLATWFDQMEGYDRDPGVQTLRDIGFDSVVYLRQQMNRKDTFLREKYVAFWPSLPAFVKSRLKRPKSAASIRIKAIGTLREMGQPFSSSEIGFATLIAALNHPDIEVRSRAEGALGDLGVQAKAAVPALIKSVERRSRVSTGHISINGIWALGQIGPDARPAIPLLESIVKETTGRERVFAAEALMAVGGDTSTATAALEKALEDEDSQARREAAEVLSKVRFTIVPY